jgi:hypothetical protein
MQKSELEVIKNQSSDSRCANETHTRKNRVGLILIDVKSENGRFKDNLSDFSRKPSTREKRPKMELVINAKGNLYGNTVRQGNTSALAIDRRQKSVHFQTKKLTCYGAEQICESLERFPNFKAEKNVKVPVDGKVHEPENVVTRNCDSRIEFVH